MPLRTSIVGTTVGPRTFVLEARHAMAYAAGTGDPNPAYFDDTRPGGVVAPPMFGVRLDWPLRPFRADEAGLTREEAARSVHATHDMTFHRPARAGDCLITTGRVVAIEQRSAGAYLVTRYDTVDVDGAPVLTVFYGSLFRGVAIEGPPASPRMAPRRWERASQAETRPESLGNLPLSISPSHVAAGEGAGGWGAPIHVPREMPHVYTECADIWNPIHTELSVALAAGLPDIILHGTATLALAAREVLNREAGAEPARLARIGCRFGAMVIPGTTIQVRATGETAAEGGRVVYFAVDNAEGGPAIRDGFALIRD